MKKSDKATRMKPPKKNHKKEATERKPQKGAPVINPQEKPQEGNNKKTQQKETI